MKVLRFADALPPLSLLLMLISCSPAEQQLVATGTIEAVEVRVSAKVGGQVLELSAEEGSSVIEGQVLARIDHSSLDLQLAQAGAGVRVAEAQIELLLKGAREEDIRQAENAITQSEENQRIARDDAQRMRDLFASGSISEKQRDEAEARLVVAQAQNSSASQALRKLQNLARPEEVEAARAALEQAGVSVKLLEKSITDAAVRAPRDGIITHRLVETGELVTPGARLFILSDLSRVELTVYVSETVLGRISLGQPATIGIDDRSQSSFVGRITFISPEAEFTPKNVQTREERVKLVFRVRISIPNPELILKPGMPADAILLSETAKP